LWEVLAGKEAKRWEVKFGVDCYSKRKSFGEKQNNRSDVCLLELKEKRD